VLLPLTGCSANEPTPVVSSRAPVTTPAPTPTTTSATSAPVTLSPTTPTSVATVSLPAPTFRPEGTFNEDDAIGFAAFYLLVLNHARATGDSSQLRSISEPDCGACADQARAVDVARAKGLVGQNLDVHFDSGQLNYFAPSTQEADVLVETSNANGSYLNADGSTFADVPALKSTGLIQIHRRDGSWFVQEVPG